MSVLFVLIIAWVVVGLVAGLVMGRRGHSWFAWAVIGCVLGPLVIPVAMSTIRGEHETSPITLARGEPGPGLLRVMVGVDGSAESRAALNTVIMLLDDRLGTLTLAAVVNHEAARAGWKGEDQESAEAALVDAARTADASRVGTANTVLLAGKPARALLDHAATTNADLVAIGSRGRGVSKALLGSVATQLAANSVVPVLIVGESAPRSPQT